GPGGTRIEVGDAEALDAESGPPHRHPHAGARTMPLDPPKRERRRRVERSTPRPEDRRPGRNQERIAAAQYRRHLDGLALEVSATDAQRSLRLAGEDQSDLRAAHPLPKL